ncbi:hypothetical protein IAD21_01817 [Abditibacteriota bacterium]|nr:hypothetical protein IAD21_01817 [Abditibacteriota bacterium]
MQSLLVPFLALFLVGVTFDLVYLVGKYVEVIAKEEVGEGYWFSFVFYTMSGLFFNGLPTDVSSSMHVSVFIVIVLLGALKTVAWAFVKLNRCSTPHR